jgi:predicted RNase H-like HicB family nuclease
MTYFVGIVDGSGDVWGVRIPDFPGCHGAGSSIENAVADATRALREFATDMINDGEALPEARDMLAIDKVLVAADEPDGIRVYIPLLVDKGRSVRANISLDAGLLEKIDSEAKRRGLTRSAFLASAAMDKIADAR